MHQPPQEVRRSMCSNNLMAIKAPHPKPKHSYTLPRHFPYVKRELILKRASVIRHANAHLLMRARNANVADGSEGIRQIAHMAKKRNMRAK